MKEASPCCRRSPLKHIIKRRQPLRITSAKIGAKIKRKYQRAIDIAASGGADTRAPAWSPDYDIMWRSEMAGTLLRVVRWRIGENARIVLAMLKPHYKQSARCGMRNKRQREEAIDYCRAIIGNGRFRGEARAQHLGLEMLREASQSPRIISMAHHRPKIEIKQAA